MEEMLRDVFVRPPAPSGRPRASKPRNVDEAARAGFGQLFRRRGKTKLVGYDEIEPVVARATGADRRQRRIEATVRFCDSQILGPFFVSSTGAPVLTRALPTLVSEYRYGWGPVVYQTTLEGLQ